MWTSTKLKLKEDIWFKLNHKLWLVQKNNDHRKMKVNPKPNPM